MIKIFISDIDGVWTDGTFYYGPQGYTGKKFHTYDSAGVLFLKILNIPVAFVSGEASGETEERARKLQVNHCFTGVQNKVQVIEKLLNELNLNWENVAYIGDDINDLKVFEKAALTACPAQAPGYIKEKVDWVLSQKGGQGVFREFVEKFLEENNLLDQVINQYLREH